MTEELQSLTFIPLNLEDPAQIGRAFSMRRDMYVANGDPASMSDERFPDNKTYAGHLRLYEINEFISLSGKPIGFYNVGFHLPKNPEGACLGMIHFDEDQRGKGWGRVVLEHVKTECRIRNLPSLVLHSKKANPVNTAIYAKLGFICEGDVDETGFLLKWKMDL